MEHAAYCDLIVCQLETLGLTQAASAADGEFLVDVRYGIDQGTPVEYSTPRYEKIPGIGSGSASTINSINLPTYVRVGTTTSSVIWFASTLEIRVLRGGAVPDPQVLWEIRVLTSDRRDEIARVLPAMIIQAFAPQEDLRVSETREWSQAEVTVPTALAECRGGAAPSR